MFDRPKDPLNRYADLLGITIDAVTPTDLASYLRVLAIKHFQRYPFHSLYFNLEGKRIELDRNALIRQLIEDSAGSCYHHNALFQAVLERIGIESWFIACLVHDPMSPNETFAAVTHIAIIFKYQSSVYLFDPGWDGTSFSIYPLPSTVGEITRHDKYQVRKKEGEADFPFVFEEMKPDGSVVPRYDFSSEATALMDFAPAVQYLNSPDYAFYTLFLFTQITADQQIIRLINRYLIIQDLAGSESYHEELSADVSPMQEIVARLGPQEGVMASVSSTGVFKNPALGLQVCQPISSPTIVMNAK